MLLDGEFSFVRLDFFSDNFSDEIRFDLVLEATFGEARELEDG